MSEWHYYKLPEPITLKAGEPFPDEYWRAFLDALQAAPEHDSEKR
ncbi:Uncharacterised protein [Mycobacteroides abscessus subsp. massiliense]|nr:hypothetical protein [Mycobacteroides abscessus]SKU70209.1 Uncharacterised protein [Mycobacteroides abscessus subsp. massiliense]SKU76790.1 Uncharacterised protein [Mycobacteroides abscessus subsp. massiliense]